MIDEQPIGFLIVKAGLPGLHVVGSCCADRYAAQIVLPHGVRSFKAASVYHINIYPYKQTCCECGGVLVSGQPCGDPDGCERTATEGREHTHWCELYSGS